MNLFNCKITYLKQAENGNIVNKTEVYEVEALSFTEAEANLQKHLEEYIPSYNLVAMKKSGIAEVHLDESKDFFFTTKVLFASFDEDSGKEKKINNTFLIQAASVEESTNKVKELMKGSVIDWEMSSVVKTNVVDVFLAAI